MNTIHSYPHLFPIITPVDVDRFKLLLHNHPNTALISSVCCGLRSGFWLFPILEKPENSPQGRVMQLQGPPMPNDEALVFFKLQCDIEISLEQYSQAFRASLLPGMVAHPI